MNLNSLLLYTCTDAVTFWQCLLIASTRKSVGSEAIKNVQMLLAYSNKSFNTSNIQKSRT